MQSQRLKVGLALCGAAGALFAGAAGAAIVEVNGLVLHADGGFQPHKLPRRQYVPIDFQGHVDARAKAGGPPPVLTKAVIDFDRDGRLSAGGLPTCGAEQVANATPEQARNVCRNAIVGTGHVEASIALASGAVRVKSPLTLFNGSPQDGHPTVLVHAQTTVPGTQTFAIVVPIERRRGEYRYRAILEPPPIAAGLGALTHVDVKIGRRFRAGGQRHSYVSARCSDGILRTHGRFVFADGTIVDGSVDKPCGTR